MTVCLVIIYVVYFRFFFGKNRVMQLALGRSGAEEYKDGLHLVAEVCTTKVYIVTLYDASRPRSCMAIVVYCLPTPAVLM